MKQTKRKFLYLKATQGIGHYIVPTGTIRLIDVYISKDKGSITQLKLTNGTVIHVEESAKEIYDLIEGVTDA